MGFQGWCLIFKINRRLPRSANGKVLYILLLETQRGDSSHTDQNMSRCLSIFVSSG